MTRDRVLYLFFALLLATGGMIVALRLTEPPGRTPSPSEIRQRYVEAQIDQQEQLERLAVKLQDAGIARKPGNFRSHLDYASVYARILRARRLRDTGGASGKYAPDPFLRSLPADCRKLAKTPSDWQQISRLESGE